MKVLCLQEANLVVGGYVPIYTWYKRKQVDATHCLYDRYRHDLDKHGNPTSVIQYEGSNLLSCNKPQTWTGTIGTEANPGS